MKIRITVGGCRTYDDYEMFKTKMDNVISTLIDDFEIVILSGHCKGVDMLAERYAFENEFSVEIYKAEWSKYGKSAGPKRNMTMVQNCDYVIAFWDGKSRGTKNLIELAKKYDKQLTIEYIQKPLV